MPTPLSINQQKIIVAIGEREEVIGFVLQRRSKVGVGAFYADIYALEKRNLVKGRWGVQRLNEAGRPRYYRLTDKGRQLREILHT